MKQIRHLPEVSDISVSLILVIADTYLHKFYTDMSPDAAFF